MNLKNPKFSYFIVSNYLKMQKPLPRVFFDISINKKPQGRLIFELFENYNPKTTENFRELATSQTNSYKNTKIHNVVTGLMVQGGKIPQTNSSSIYGAKFADESFTISHNKAGILSMANTGPNTNGSQFFITLQPAQWLDKKNVAFGQLVDGFNVLADIELQGTTEGKDLADIEITNSGELPAVVHHEEHDDHH